MRCQLSLMFQVAWAKAAVAVTRSSGWMKDPGQLTVPGWVPFMIGMSKRMLLCSGS